MEYWHHSVTGVLKANSGSWVPLGVLLGYALLGVCLYLVLKNVLNCLSIKTGLTKAILKQKFVFQQHSI